MHEAAQHLVDDPAGLDRVGVGLDPRVPGPRLRPVVPAAVHAPQRDAVAARAVVGPDQRDGTGEGQQGAVVVVLVGEGDEGLHPAAVVPGQAAPGDPGVQAPVQDRVALLGGFDIITSICSPYLRE